MFSVKGITKIYKNGSTKQKALDDINLSFEKGEFISIVGESGSGKSTLLNILSGLDSPTTGHLEINGINTKDFSSKEWAIYRSQYLGFVFQEFNLIEHLSLVENVELPLLLQGKSKIEARDAALEILGVVGLSKHVDKMPKYISGGQRQRVSIARSLVHNPDIILADEPTGSLDSENSIIIMNMLKKLGENKIIINVTHDEELSKPYNTRLVRLEDGKVIEDTNPKMYSTEKPGKLPQREPKMSLGMLTKFANNNFRIKRKRNVFSGLTIAIGFIAVLLLSFFLIGMKKSLLEGTENLYTPNYIKVESAELFDSNDLTTIKGLPGITEAFYSNSYEFSIVSDYRNNLLVGDRSEEQYIIKDMLRASPSKKEYIASATIYSGKYPTNSNEILVSYDFASYYLKQSAKEFPTQGDLDKRLSQLQTNGDILYIYDEASCTFDDTKEVAPFDCTGLKELKIVGVSNNVVNMMPNDNIESATNIPLEASTELNVFTDHTDKNTINQIIEDLVSEGYSATSPYFDTESDVNDVFNTVFIVIASIASVSFLVSFIFIGILMWNNAVERTKEIGILNAIGARKSSISYILIIEAGLLGLLTAVISIGVAVVLSYLLNGLVGLLMPALLNITVFDYDIKSIAIIGLSSILFVIIATAIPAIKAANMKVIKALRRE